MNFRDLRYLVAVAEHRHFGRAAEACFVSQPTLSTQLKKLEEFLGVTLVERNNRQVMLTPVGESIVAQAQRVLREANQLVGIAEAHRDPYGGDFRLGIIPTVAPYFLPRVLAPLRKAFPNLSLQLTESQTATLTQLLKNGELDAVVLALPLEDEQIEERVLYREPFYLAVSKKHAFARRASVRQSDLGGQDVLLLEDGHCLRDQALEVCSAHSAVENTNFRATSIETLRQMVAADVGVTLMPQLAMGGRQAGIRYVPFEGKAPPHRDVGLCWRSTSTRADLLEDMAGVLAELELTAD